MPVTIAGADLLRGVNNQLPDELQNAFRARARTIRVRRDQIVVAEGIEATDVYLIASGRVKFSLYAQHGREMTLREMAAGQIFGELSAVDGQPRSVSVVAVEDASLYHLSGDEFIAFLRDTPSAGLWIARQLSMRVRDLTAKIFELTTMAVNTRLHRELMRLGLESGVAADAAVIDRFPTHSDLASRIGTHREAITRELGLLHKEKIIRQVGRRMHILSVERLQQMIARIVH
jgi:CRP/FNR family cyclic AMP-dependent transcriptional regulator